jgi:predicted nucleic acid-binding protein
VGLTVLDAGVIIGVLDATDVHHDAARDAMGAAVEQGDALVVPASAYAECLVEPARRGNKAVQMVNDFLFDLSADVEPITRQVAARAAQLRAEHGTRLRLPDALVVAIALHLKADRVLTTDRGWPRVDLRVELVGS